MHILLTVLDPYSSYGTSKENSSKYQDMLSLVITSFILTAWMFEQVVIRLREISFWSLLGLKELRGWTTALQQNVHIHPMEG